MESLNKLRGSLLGVSKSKNAKPYGVYIIKNLIRIEKEFPNDAKLGEELRKIIRTAEKHYNL